MNIENMKMMKKDEEENDGTKTMNKVEQRWDIMKTMRTWSMDGIKGGGVGGGRSWPPPDSQASWSE